MVDDLRPLRRARLRSLPRADASAAGATCRVNRPFSTQGASSSSIVADPIGEDDSLAVPVKPVIDERLVGRLALGARQRQFRP